MPFRDELLIFGGVCSTPTYSSGIITSHYKSSMEERQKRFLYDKARVPNLP